MQDNNELLRVTLYRNIDNSVDWFEPFTITEDDIIDCMKRKNIPYNFKRDIARQILTKLKGDGISNSPL